MIAGFHYGIRMVVIRLEDGGLFVWSPIPLSNALRVKVDALGAIRHIVAPNAFHHLYLGEWQAAYPEALVYAPPGLRKKRKDIRFDRDLDATPAEWASEIDVVLVDGNLLFTEAVFFHAKSGTAIFTDLIQNFEPDAFSGWRGLVARTDLMIAPEPTVPRKFRLSFIRRNAARASLRKILQWPIEKLIIAHGPAIDKDGRGIVQRAFSWLLG